MQLFVKQLGRSKFLSSAPVPPVPLISTEASCLCCLCSAGITAREHGSNKKLAAQSVALSLVRQLYHLGVIEPYSGVTKKKEGETVGRTVDQRTGGGRGGVQKHFLMCCLTLTDGHCLFMSSWSPMMSSCPQSFSSSWPLLSRNWESSSPCRWVATAPQYIHRVCVCVCVYGVHMLCLCSPQTPAPQCLWSRGGWPHLNHHSATRWLEWFPGHHLRSTGIPGSAATLTRGRWPT